MIKSITIIFTFLILSNSHSQSLIEYQSGTNLEVGTGADICSDNKIINGSYSGSGSFCEGPLPVSVSSFTHIVKHNNVTLKWITEWELNNLGFDIERKEMKNGIGWTKISFVNGSGNSENPIIYTFEDKKLSKGIFSYRIKQIDYNGNFEYFQLQSDVSINPPSEFRISQNYPNPSNPKSKIDYELPVNGMVSIKIYNSIGQEVASILNETKEAGYYTAVFDGTYLSSGVYFYRFVVKGEGQSFSRTLKMMLLK